MKCRNFYIYFLSLLLISFSSCGDSEKENQPDAVETNNEEVGGNDLVSTIQGVTNLSRFSMEMGAAEIPEFQRKGRAYTIFAPRNSAFTPFYDESGNRIIQTNSDELISYHIVPEVYTIEKLLEQIKNADGELTLSTLQGEEITVTEEDEKVWVEGKIGEKAQITETLDAYNGVVHVLDQVLLPTRFSRPESGNQE